MCRMRESRGLAISLLYNIAGQRHNPWMLPEILVELIIEMVRTLLVEEASDRVLAMRPCRRLRGMNDVHRHVRAATRRRLLKRLSTEMRR